MTRKKSFFRKLVDFSFSDFIAPRVVGVIYFLSIIGVALAVLGAIFSSLFYGGILQAIGTLVVAIIAAAVYLLFIRVGLEALVAGIKTAENTTEIKEYLRQMRNENGEYVRD